MNYQLNQLTLSNYFLTELCFTSLGKIIILVINGCVVIN